MVELIILPTKCSPTNFSPHKSQGNEKELVTHSYQSSFYNVDKKGYQFDQKIDLLHNAIQTTKVS